MLLCSDDCSWLTHLSTLGWLPHVAYTWGAAVSPVAPSQRDSCSDGSFPPERWRPAGLSRGGSLARFAGCCQTLGHVKLAITKAFDSSCLSLGYAGALLTPVYVPFRRVSAHTSLSCCRCASQKLDLPCLFAHLFQQWKFLCGYEDFGQVQVHQLFGNKLGLHMTCLPCC